ncbi:MAG TPA: hypothetical protein VNR38_06310 [Ureibacillus sp.]|nr:hypothetical protein [Ureibacillus sp.]
MNLTNEEKYKIYLEEKKRIEIEEEVKRKQREEDMINSLTEVEKKDIYNEINEKRIVYAGKNDIKQPQITDNAIGWLSGLGFVFIYFFVSMSGAFIFGIGWFILYMILRSKKILITTPEIQYKCPICNHNHTAFLRIEEKNEMLSNDYIKARCFRCSENFSLVIDKSILDSITLK